MKIVTKRGVPDSQLVDVKLSIVTEGVSDSIEVLHQSASDSSLCP